MLFVRRVIKRASEQPLVRRSIGFGLSHLPQVRRTIDAGLTVFTYHEISDAPSRFAAQFGLSVSPGTFRRQLQFIKANFNVVRPLQLLTGQSLPSRSALITFDDGFLGAFENGLPILKELNLPSVHFLNMQSILARRPITSAVACYLDLQVPAFLRFAESVGLKPPFHHTLTPSLLAEYERQHELDYAAITGYQGPLADIETVRRRDGDPDVYFGNHLFEHWNAAALTAQELEEQFLENEAALAPLANRVNLFAFTNGQPNICFSRRDINTLQRLGTGRVFSSAGGIARDPTQFWLDRFCLTGPDEDPLDAWYRLGRAALTLRTLKGTSP